MSGLTRALVVLTLCCGLGVLADVPAPADVHGHHLFPMGLIAVALHQVHGRQRRVVSALAFLTTSGTLFALGSSPASAVLHGAAGVLAALVALRLLGSSVVVRPLRSESGWARVVLASICGGLVFAVAAALAGLVDGGGSTEVLVLAAFINALASLLLWLPLAIRTPRLDALAGRAERTTQWCALLLASILVFSDTSPTPFVYVVFALLCWSALRLSLTETLAQLVVVHVAATTFTAHGMGPYAASVTQYDLPPDLELVFAQLFLIVCTACVVALSLSSARTRAETRLESMAGAEDVASHRLSTVVAELEAERTRVEEMRQVDKVKDALVSTVSHELRTPITNIIGYSEMLEDGDYGNLSSDQTVAMTKIEDNSRRLLGLIDDLLTQSRMRSSQVDLACSPVDLVRVVRSAEEAILPRLANAGLSLEMDLPQEPVVVSVDAEKMERALVNLLSNAVKFTPRAGQVTVRVRRADTWAVLEVCDTGYGIAPEDLERLFSQFFRTSAAESRHIQGAGLGLSIVRSIVEAHGGHVDVSSVLDAGTTFRVHLPAVLPT